MITQNYFIQKSSRSPRVKRLKFLLHLGINSLKILVFIYKSSVENKGNELTGYRLLILYFLKLKFLKSIHKFLVPTTIKIRLIL